MITNTEHCFHPTQGEHERPIDEEHVQEAHKKAYKEDKPGSLPASALGSAAAMEVIQAPQLNLHLQHTQELVFI